jgi:protein-disulfide isomerase
MSNSRFRLSLACVLAMSSQAPGAAAQDTEPDLREEVRQLREEVRVLQRDLQELKQALPTRRATGWEPVEMVLGPEDSPQRGAPDAQLVLIEFSDYQCPYCARHFAQTYPQLERDFVATGKLRYVAAEFPLPQLHPLAIKAAEAARCAREQGRFWEMHARLFASQRQLEPWSAHAQAVGLDEGAFDTCMSSGRHVEEIQRNAAQAQRGGIASTPTFLLGIADGDTVRVVRRLRGAAPYPVFKAEIESLLAGRAADVAR